METSKMLTSLLVLTLTGPTLGYPYTRDFLSRNHGRSRDHHQVMENTLSDYLGDYVQNPMYGRSQEQQLYQRDYAPQRDRINTEALAALLPYLTTTSNNDDYAYDYNSYGDDDGTWYDDVANDDVSDATTTTTDRDNAALLQFLLDHRYGRYSLEDLETLEREAKMEDNTENQLHALMAQKMNKKSYNMPLLGAQPIAIATPILQRKGQKEEALTIPSTSVRRPIFAREIVTEPEQTEPESKRNVQSSASDSTSTLSSSSAQETAAAAVDQKATVNSAAAVPVPNAATAVEQTPMTPFMQSKYDAFIKYLERERKVRQNQDIEQELQQETKSQPQKRFVTEQDVLSQQLANLKKKVA